MIDSYGRTTQQTLKFAEPAVKNVEPPSPKFRPVPVKWATTLLASIVVDLNWAVSVKVVAATAVASPMF
jgi:hypothetical protein